MNVTTNKRIILYTQTYQKVAGMLLIVCLLASCAEKKTTEPRDNSLIVQEKDWATDLHYLEDMLRADQQSASDIFSDIYNIQPAINTAREKAKAFKYTPQSCKELATALSHLGRQYFYQENIYYKYKSLQYCPKALQYYQYAFDLQESLHMDNHADVAASYTHVGWIYYCLNDLQSALDSFKKALQIQLVLYKQKEENAVAVAKALSCIGLVCYCHHNAHETYYELIEAIAFLCQEEQPAHLVQASSSRVPTDGDNPNKRQAEQHAAIATVLCHVGLAHYCLAPPRVPVQDYARLFLAMHQALHQKKQSANQEQGSYRVEILPPYFLSNVRQIRAYLKHNLAILPNLVKKIRGHSRQEESQNDLSQEITAATSSKSVHVAPVANGQEEKKSQRGTKGKRNTGGPKNTEAQKAADIKKILKELQILLKKDQPSEAASNANSSNSPQTISISISKVIDLVNALMGYTDLYPSSDLYAAFYAALYSLCSESELSTPFIGLLDTLATYLRGIGWHWYQHNAAKAFTYYNYALRIQEHLHKDQVTLAATLANVGWAYVRLDYLDQALNYFEQALKIQHTLYQKNDAACTVQKKDATCAEDIAGAVQNNKNHAVAKALYRVGLVYFGSKFPNKKENSALFQALRCWPEHPQPGMRKALLSVVPEESDSQSRATPDQSSIDQAKNTIIAKVLAHVGLDYYYIKYPDQFCEQSSQQISVYDTLSLAINQALPRPQQICKVRSNVLIYVPNSAITSDRALEYNCCRLNEMLS